jgi:hypothetical protein
MALPPGQHDVGRMSDCWLTLDDELASRYHARFWVVGDTVEVEDLESRNGTYVNGEKITGRVALQDGDRVRIGRELMAIIESDDVVPDEDSDLRRTLAPGEDTRFPSLIGQLVEKSLRVGKLKEAERYATALTNQLALARVESSHPAAQAVVDCLLGLAERSSSGVWIDKLFKLFVAQEWLIDGDRLDRIRGALDRIPRVPGTGIADYEKMLRKLERDGIEVPAGLTAMIAELSDAYGSA